MYKTLQEIGENLKEMNLAYKEFRIQEAGDLENFVYNKYKSCQENFERHKYSKSTDKRGEKTSPRIAFIIVLSFSVNFMTLI